METLFRIGDEVTFDWGTFKIDDVSRSIVSMHEVITGRSVRITQQLLSQKIVEYA